MKDNNHEYFQLFCSFIQDESKYEKITLAIKSKDKITQLFKIRIFQYHKSY